LPESSDLSEEDRKLCFSVASQSWSALGLPGDPDLADLPVVVSTLIQAEANYSKNVKKDGGD
jgi:hypothetical protein